jgi:hypothetical protein
VSICACALFGGCARLTLRPGSIDMQDVIAQQGRDPTHSWRLRTDLELSVIGRNLFSGGHGEFTDPATRTQFGQDIFFKVEYRV